MSDSKPKEWNQKHRNHLEHSDINHQVMETPQQRIIPARRMTNPGAAGAFDEDDHDYNTFR
jgi:hypothetical protein